MIYATKNYSIWQFFLSFCLCLYALMFECLHTDHKEQLLHVEALACVLHGLAIDDIAVLDDVMHEHGRVHVHTW